MLRSYSEIFKEWKKEAGIRGPILIGAFPNLRDAIKICTDRPGALIGKGGERYEKYKKKLLMIYRYYQLKYLILELIWLYGIVMGI